jgi:hypothetical protein
MRLARQPRGPEGHYPDQIVNERSAIRKGRRQPDIGRMYTIFGPWSQSRFLEIVALVVESRRRLPLTARAAPSAPSSHLLNASPIMVPRKPAAVPLNPHR